MIHPAAATTQILRVLNFLLSSQQIKRSRLQYDTPGGSYETDTPSIKFSHSEQ
jgi:hypothetical protein